jgi:hypothetical protein
MHALRHARRPAWQSVVHSDRESEAARGCRHDEQSRGQAHQVPLIPERLGIRAARQVRRVPAQVGRARAAAGIVEMTRI